jgi:hypothetical protein
VLGLRLGLTLYAGRVLFPGLTFRALVGDTCGCRAGLSYQVTDWGADGPILVVGTGINAEDRHSSHDSSHER